MAFFLAKEKKPAIIGTYRNGGLGMLDILMRAGINDVNLLNDWLTTNF